MSTFLNHILRWFRGTETPRWVLVAGAFFTIITSYYSAVLVQDAGRVDENRAEQVRSLLTSMVDFPVFASAFSTEMFDGGTASTAARSNLVQNLNGQFAKLATVTPLLSPATKPVVDEYRQAILRMREALDKAQGISSMKDFWSAASHLTLARNRLNKELQEAI